MPTVTGDIAINFSALPDENPWVDSNYSVIAPSSGSFQILSGTLLRTGSGTTAAFIVSGVTPGGVITAKAELTRPSGQYFDDDGPAILDSAGNGYWLRVHGGGAGISLVTNFSRGAEIVTLSPGSFSANSAFALTLDTSTGAIEGFLNGAGIGSGTDTTYTTGLQAGALSIYDNNGSYGYTSFAADGYATGPDYTTRKGSSLDSVTHGLGTITTATLNGVNVFDHVTSQAAGTVSFSGVIADEITTSGEYDLVLGDGVGTETYTVQVNVYGIAPSNNPLQKDGAALASLTGVQVRITAGANLNGAERYYSGTQTTDGSGNLSNIDLSTTAVNNGDSVLMTMLTAAGDSIVATETVELI